VTNEVSTILETMKPEILSIIDSSIDRAILAPLIQHLGTDATTAQLQELYDAMKKDRNSDKFSLIVLGSHLNKLLEAERSI
jgi:hypothetical protein